MLAAALLLQQPTPDAIALCLLGFAFVQLAYMALKPTMPWVLVVFWVMAQWQSALIAMERAPTPELLGLLGLALLVQAYLVLSIGLAGLGHFRELRRLRTPPDNV